MLVTIKRVEFYRLVLLRYGSVLKFAQACGCSRQCIYAFTRSKKKRVRLTNAIHYADVLGVGVQRIVEEDVGA